MNRRDFLRSGGAVCAGLALPGIDMAQNSRAMLTAYWLPSVGIGPARGLPPVYPNKQTVTVPVTDVLNYRRRDGSPQVDVINLMGCTFQNPFTRQQYLSFKPNLTAILTDGSIQKVQAAGVRVVLTITGAGDSSTGWSSIPAPQIPGFAQYLNQSILGRGGYGLDGIDIDDEYAENGDTLVETLRAMRAAFPPGKIISKALFRDLEVIPQIRNYLTYGAIMQYGNDAGQLEDTFDEYVGSGMRPDRILIGVNAGPVGPGHSPSFTSIATARQLAAWQPENGRKLGMMLWSFSQDIQQFTASPQNQPGLKFPNPEDHAWQRTMMSRMDT